MKILIYSPSFYPNVGGLETIICTLAHEFVNLGHQVKVVSQTPENQPKQFPFEIIRFPKLKQLIALTYWCDVYCQGCISLKGIYPLFISSKPLIATHHTWYRRNNGSISWQDYLKRLFTLFATNITVSQAIADDIPGKSVVIPNCYEDNNFYHIPEVKRDKELVFLGRLVSDKGVNLLLEVMANLKSIGLTLHLTIIGEGPEENNLRQQAKDLEIEDRVNFVGVKRGRELTELLNAHQIMVVPSLWNEPFGIVALEGIACGCVVVGSEGGGLKDAIGTCGTTFPNGDTSALTKILAELLTSPEKLDTYRTHTPEHLSRHKKTKVANAYLEVMKAAVQ